MAEAYEKTEAPTPRRRAEARRDGQVARSGDLVAAAVLLAALVLVQTSGEEAVAAFRELVAASLSAPAEAMTTADAVRFTKSLSVALLPLAAGVVVVAVVANALQFGFLWRMPYRGDALDMSKGWQRMFSPR